MLNLVVLVSGQGSNLQAILNAIEEKRLDASVRAVISNRHEAYGLTRARAINIPTHVISSTNFDEDMINCIDHYAPNLVVLAGFMKKLSPRVVQHYSGRMINIHPSLLPKHPGLHTHERALAAGDTQHGATVHFVTEILDAGPIIEQYSLAINPTDTPESLQQRVLQLEHRLYPEVLQRFAEGLLP